MHNTDRTVREMPGYEAAFESDEMSNEWFGEMADEFEAPLGEMYESPFSEVQELELATELLSVTNEAELDQFLGKLVRKVGPGLKKAWNSPLGGLLRKGLKFVAPIAGRVVGGMFGGPVGAQLGSKLASGAVRLFRLELEGLSAEDQEFEVARAYVRFAGETARQAETKMQQGLPPKQVVQAAMSAAAKRHAPGLLESSANYEYSNGESSDYADGSNQQRRQSSPAHGIPARGTWVRSGRRIFIQIRP